MTLDFKNVVNVFLATVLLLAFSFAQANSLAQQSYQKSQVEVTGLNTPDSNAAISQDKSAVSKISYSLVGNQSKGQVVERSSGCSTGCSTGCSVGCSSGCSVGCSSGCSSGCR